MCVVFPFLRQTKNMLSRTKSHRQVVVGFVALIAVAFVGQPTAQGHVRIPPKVTIQNFVPEKHVRATSGHKYTFEILRKMGLTPFVLVGVTWQGKLAPNTTLEVKTHNESGWSTWEKLSYSPEHGPDSSATQEQKARSGTDPLITAKSDGIDVRVISSARALPKDLKVSLIDSVTSNDDVNTFLSAKSAVGIRQNLGSVITKSGAVVSRPNIVSRAQWGADESWRDPSPRISSKIIAGFIHHTATTNSYNPEDGPAQMRSLYAYFTKSLKYSDMGYNFLVDRYGVVYEGRAGCTPTADPSCDGPSKAVIGAHTAGMNHNTFAISAIGNFQTGSIDASTERLITKAISGLMAWKIAPYNLDPTALVKIPSTDTSGLSKYRNGTVATVQVISGHRDVGKTVCPGKALFALIPEIRGQIAGLLGGEIKNVSVTPLQQSANDPSTISVKASVPVSSTWTVTVMDAESGVVVYLQSGTQRDKSNFVYEWEHTDTSGHLVPAGNYAVSLSATVANKQLPTETTMVTLGSKPQQMSGVKIKRMANGAAVVTWPVQANSVPQVDAIFYRTSSTKGSTWTVWKQLPEAATEKTFTTTLKKRRIFIEIKQTNAIGDSAPVLVSFVAKS